MPNQLSGWRLAVILLVKGACAAEAASSPTTNSTEDLILGFRKDTFPWVATAVGTWLLALSIVLLAAYCGAGTDLQDEDDDETFEMADPCRLHAKEEPSSQNTKPCPDSNDSSRSSSEDHHSYGLADVHYLGAPPYLLRKLEAGGTTGDGFPHGRRGNESTASTERMGSGRSLNSIGTRASVSPGSSSYSLRPLNDIVRS